MTAANGGAQMPVITSLAGSHLFNQGNRATALAVPTSGTFGLAGSTATNTEASQGSLVTRLVYGIFTPA